MAVAVLDDAAALRALWPEWEALWRARGRSAFQSPAWLLPWLEVFGTAEPRVAVARQGRVLAGVLPGYVLDEGGGRKLLPVGAGTTDYLDALGGEAAPMLRALLERAALDGVRRCDLVEVPPGSTLLGLAVPGWESAWSDGAACPVLALDAIPSGVRRKLRMNRHRADREGGWSVEQADAAALPGALDALSVLHRARWEAAGEPGVMADPAVGRFLRAASSALLEAGLLRLCVLRVGGAVAAAALALLAPGRIEFYLSGYDPARAFVSPGTLLLGAMLEQAAAEGRAEAHFLRGQEGYKYAWGAVDRLNAQGAFRLAD